MSEFSPQGFGDPGADPAEAASGAKRDPRLLIGGGLAVAIAAVAGAYLLLGGGSGSDAGSPSVAAHHPVATATATVVPIGTPAAHVRTFNGDVGRDPFRALVTPPPAVATGSTSGATGATGGTATTAPAPTTTPGTVVGPTSLPTSGPTLPVTTTVPVPTPTATQAAKIMVVLKAIAFHGQTPYVLVHFDGAQYALKTGDTAASSLKVVAIAPDDGTATFQLGDQTFDLHIGQSYVD